MGFIGDEAAPFLLRALTLRGPVALSFVDLVALEDALVALGRRLWGGLRSWTRSRRGEQEKRVSGHGWATLSILHARFLVFAARWRSFVLALSSLSISAASSSLCKATPRRDASAARTGS